MDFLLTIHSYVRWLIVIVAILALLKFAYGWLQKKRADPMDRGLMSGFSGLMDLQALLGLIYLVTTGITTVRLEHAFVMLLAAALSHVATRWRKRDDAGVLRNDLLVIAGALVLVFIGVSILPGGWARPARGL